MKLLIAFFFLNHISFGQSVAYSNFSTVQNLNKVFVSWDLDSGSICNGIRLYRSVDKINYSLIHTIEGVCGSANNKVSYSHNDPTPVLNAWNYYRLEFNGNENSEVDSVRIIEVSKEVRVYPNPVSNSLSFSVENAGNESLIYQIISSNGKTVKTGVITSSFGNVVVSELLSGAYIIRVIFPNNREVSGFFQKF